MQQSVVMCKTCARAIKYTGNAIPDGHADVGEECPTPYLE